MAASPAPRSDVFTEPAVLINHSREWAPRSAQVCCSLPGTPSDVREHAVLKQIRRSRQRAAVARMSRHKTPILAWLSNQRASVVHCAAPPEIKVGRSVDPTAPEIDSFRPSEHSVILAKQTHIIQCGTIACHLDCEWIACWYHPILDGVDQCDIREHEIVCQDLESTTWDCWVISATHLIGRDCDTLRVPQTKQTDGAFGEREAKLFPVDPGVHQDADPWGRDCTIRDAVDGLLDQAAGAVA